MNKVYKLILTLIVGLLIVSCNKSDGAYVAPKRDYAEQYAADNDSIVKFLQTHYMEVVDDESLPNFGDVTFTEIPEGGTQTSVWNETDIHRKLRTRLVNQNDIVYTVYYISFRDGEGEKPCNVDGVYANYKGTLLNGSIFDQTTNVQKLLLLEGVIRGWSEIFPQFASGTYSSNGDGTTSFDGFGAGVMFLPSALGYYNVSQTTVPAYSPLIFTIKLYEIKRMDQDVDGIPSYLEDLNGDGYIYSLGKDDAGVNIPNPDNTDGDITLFPNGDVFPDYLDLDDDADHVLTTTETLQYTYTTAPFKKVYYSYDGAATDDPLTPYDETQGIPDCSLDYTTPGRVRRYLDPSCH